MIDINDKSRCCGCSACAQKCPKHCITMTEDSEGFLYPKVNKEQCVNCGICEHVCIEHHPYEEHYPLKAYASKNNDDEIRSKSSSGGVFSLLAEAVLERGGVVFGVRFDDNWECVHDCIDRKEFIPQFRGSKYIQSRIGNSYIQTEKLLKDGRLVLFSGTSCQIAALNRFLNKDYENLITVEVTCHGVPSTRVWRENLKYWKRIALRATNSVSLPPNLYISERNTSIRSKDMKIESISFRDKKTGWEKFSFTLSFAEASDDGKKNTVSLSHKHKEDPYMRLFIYDVILRPSCYHCPAKSGRTKSDFTLADFWHINKVIPDFNDDKGITLVYLNSEQAISFYDKLNCEKREISIDDATKRKTAWFLNQRKVNPFRSIYFLLYSYCRFDSLANFVTNYKYVKLLLRIKNKCRRWKKK